MKQINDAPIATNVKYKNNRTGSPCFMLIPILEIENIEISSFLPFHSCIDITIKIKSAINAETNIKTAPKAFVLSFRSKADEPSMLNTYSEINKNKLHTANRLAFSLKNFTASNVSVTMTTTSLNSLSQ